METKFIFQLNHFITNILSVHRERTGKNTERGTKMKKRRRRGRGGTCLGFGKKRRLRKEEGTRWRLEGREEGREGEGGEAREGEAGEWKEWGEGGSWWSSTLSFIHQQTLSAALYLFCTSCIFCQQSMIHWEGNTEGESGMRVDVKMKVKGDVI